MVLCELTEQLRSFHTWLLRAADSYWTQLPLSEKSKQQNTFFGHAATMDSSHKVDQKTLKDPCRAWHPVYCCWILPACQRHMTQLV